MDISIELLAAYAEGKVSESERNAVRQYLTENPDQLETVMMMMDEDYDLDIEDDVDDENVLLSKGEESFSDICYSAAAFAPRIAPIQQIVENPEHEDNKSFKKCLEDLLDELDL